MLNGYSASKKYTQEEVEELVAKSPYYKATSNDVDWLQSPYARTHSEMGGPFYQRNDQFAERWAEELVDFVC